MYSTTPLIYYIWNKKNIWYRIDGFVSLLLFFVRLPKEPCLHETINDSKSKTKSVWFQLRFLVSSEELQHISQTLFFTHDKFFNFIFWILILKWQLKLMYFIPSNFYNVFKNYCFLGTPDNIYSRILNRNKFYPISLTYCSPLNLFNNI